jgi:hypothetical protein
MRKQPLIVHIPSRPPLLYYCPATLTTQFIAVDETGRPLAERSLLDWVRSRLMRTHLLTSRLFCQRAHKKPCPTGSTVWCTFGPARNESWTSDPASPYALDPSGPFAPPPFGRPLFSAFVQPVLFIRSTRPYKHVLATVRDTEGLPSTSIHPFRFGSFDRLLARSQLCALHYRTRGAPRVL